MLMLRVPPAMSGSGPAVDWELVLHFNGTRAKEGAAAESAPRVAFLARAKSYPEVDKMLLQIEHKDDTLQDMMELAKASGSGGLRPTQVAELSNSILRSNIFSCCG
ncbi:hypothetical protein PF008_g16780, partial [Phytophthora fragariae]